MTLAPGTRLGPYQIAAPIGAGGMGEVYRARDTRLARDVAIKVIPAELSRDPDRIKRFEQEARAAGALSHPNVCAIYDVGTHEGAPYVVMELLEGESLQQRLASGPVPLRKALDYAAQIAHGLSAAHEKGIVHRDLKPGNVFVTKSGRVKVLDFGLAKLTRPDVLAPAGDVTASIAATETGAILGTVGYMSPEQVRGDRADHRSDLFALGAILYELLTGKRAFHGATYVETLNAILNADPVSLTQSAGSGRAVPPAVDLIVRRCLEKAPEQRFQSANDLAFALESMSGDGSGVVAGVGLATPVRTKRWLAPALISALLACAVLVAVCVMLAQRQRHAIDPTRLKFTQLTFGRGVVAPARFSPDGKTVFYSAAWEGRPWEVFETRPGFLTSRALGLTRALLLSVSSAGMLAVKPGALSIWNFGSGLAQVPITGGATRLVSDDIFWADWHPDGRTLAVVRSVGGKDRLEMPPGRVLYATGGSRDLPLFTEVLGNLIEPRVSPDGRHVAVTETAHGGMTVTRLVVIDSTGKVEIRVEGTAGPWSPDGREVWFTTSKDKSMTELRATTPSGRQRVITRLPGVVGFWDVSRDGRTLMVQGSSRTCIRGRGSPPAEERELGWFDDSHAGDISADGKTLLFHEEGAGGGEAYAVYVRGMDGSPAVRLGAGKAMGLSPDGKWALALQGRDSQRLVLLPTGAGDSLVVPRGSIKKYLGARWMPDGKRLLVTGSESGPAWRSYVQDLAGGAQHPVTREGIIASLVSPDGRRVVYADRGKYYVKALEADSGSVVADALPGESLLQWSSQGDRLYLMQVDSASSIRISGLNLASGRRVPWRTISIPDPAGFYPYSAVITSDGQAYAITYGRLLDNLYLVEGLK